MDLISHDSVIGTELMAGISTVVSINYTLIFDKPNLVSWCSINLLFKVSYFITFILRKQHLIKIRNFPLNVKFDDFF